MTLSYEFFSNVKNMYQFFTYMCVKNQYQSLSHEQNRYQIITDVKNLYEIFTICQLQNSTAVMNNTKLLNELTKKIICEGLSSILSFFPQRVNKSSNRVYRSIHLTKFPTLLVIFSKYLKTDVLGFFEILWLSRTINLQSAFQFSVESACKICRYSVLII